VASGGPASVGIAIVMIALIVTPLWLLLVQPPDISHRLVDASPARVWSVLTEPSWNLVWVGFSRDWVARRVGGRIRSWEFAFARTAGECVVMRHDATTRYIVREVTSWVGEHGRQSSVRVWDFALSGEAGKTSVTIQVTGGRGVWDLVTRWFRGSQSQWTADRLIQAVGLNQGTGPTRSD
jgi:hypothetical protein